MGKTETVFTKESDVKNKIMELLEERVGGYWLRMVGSPFIKSGIPDIIGSYRGHFIGMEIKIGRKRGKKKYEIPNTLKKIQLLNIYNICESGGVGIVFVYLPDAEVLVEEYDKIIVFYGDIDEFVEYVKLYVDEKVDNLDVDKPVK